MDNNTEDKTKNSAAYNESAGTGTISALMFAIITTIILAIVAHFVG